MTVKELIHELIDMHDDLNVDVVCVAKDGILHEIEVVDINLINSEVRLVMGDGY